jgi:hypothetical protein
MRRPAADPATPIPTRQVEWVASDARVLLRIAQLDPSRWWWEASCSFTVDGVHTATTNEWTPATHLRARHFLERALAGVGVPGADDLATLSNCAILRRPLTNGELLQVSRSGSARR